jgi:hypothetical protein
VAFGDLPHQGQAQADTALALGVAREPVERLEDALALIGLGHAGAAVADTDLGAAVGRRRTSTSMPSPA